MAEHWRNELFFFFISESQPAQSSHPERFDSYEEVILKEKEPIFAEKIAHFLLGVYESFSYRQDSLTKDSYRENSYAGSC